MKKVIIFGSLLATTVLSATSVFANPLPAEISNQTNQNIYCTINAVIATGVSPEGNTMMTIPSKQALTYQLKNPTAGNDSVIRVDCYPHPENITGNDPAIFTVVIQNGQFETFQNPTKIAANYTVTADNAPSENPIESTLIIDQTPS